MSCLTASAASLALPVETKGLAMPETSLEKADSGSGVEDAGLLRAPAAVAEEDDRQ